VLLAVTWMSDRNRKLAIAMPESAHSTSSHLFVTCVRHPVMPGHGMLLDPSPARTGPRSEVSFVISKFGSDLSSSRIGQRNALVVADD